MDKVHSYTVGSADPGPPSARAYSKGEGRLQAHLNQRLRYVLTRRRHIA
ncbi:hypothetical protein [Roseinatronobacter sp. NSM]